MTFETQSGAFAPETKTFTPEMKACAPETKTVEMSRDVEAINRLVHAYRAENDERMAEIESKSGADVLRDEKLARMDREIDAITRRMASTEVKSRRPAFAATETATGYASEHKGAFETYIRSGQTEALMRLEAKAMNGATGPDGGYLVPTDIEQGILSRIAGLSPIRAIASVQALAGPTLRKAVSANGATRGWTADAAPSTVADPNFLSNLDFPTAELYCQPAATQTMLDDAAVDIESWIGSEVERAFAVAESAAFVNGNGVNKPMGFLSYPTVANSAWTWGSLGFVATGAAGAFPASNPSDVLVDLAHSLKSQYRQNATFVMNRKTQSVIRKYKDSAGNYLWQPPSIAGAKSTLMNFQVVESEDMPDVAANSLSIAFGDFQRGYLVVDRLGIRALRDPYSAKPYVLFYTTKRVGGGVQDFDAIKLLKFAA